MPPPAMVASTAPLQVAWFSCLKHLPQVFARICCWCLRDSGSLLSLSHIRTTGVGGLVCAAHPLAKRERQRRRRCTIAAIEALAHPHTSPGSHLRVYKSPRSILSVAESESAQTIDMGAIRRVYIQRQPFLILLFLVCSRPKGLALCSAHYSTKQHRRRRLSPIRSPTNLMYVYCPFE